MKTIGIDVGSKTIGVAVSDAFGWIAQGLTTIKWNEKDIYSADAKLKEIIKENDVDKIVVGLPRNMDGTIGERGKITMNYAEHLKKRMNITIELWDERLSTVAAERVLIEGDVSRKKRKNVIDKVAAVMILQSFLDKESIGGK